MNELPSSAIGVLRIMPATDVEVARFSKGIIEAVKQGHANPLEVLVMLRSLEAVSELVREEIEENIVTEAGKYSEKTIEAYGARIEKSEVGTKYKYETSGDIEWEQVNSEFKSLERKRKEREEFLRALKEPMTAVNRETGEVYEIRPPFKTSKSGVRVYLSHSK